MAARRFAAGGTMWCLSPRWPEHARHVAVEFVHPVIMGKRALPAVSIAGADPVVQLRSVARPGDMLVAIGTTDDVVVGEALRRAPAWGLSTVWIGCGAVPARGAADHQLWVDDDTGAAPFDGRLVLQYHLLWELTHVCFEHAGLLRPDPSECADDVCITCSDEGRVAEIVSVDDAGYDALVRTARGMEHIDVSLVGPVTRDDLVLVHAGAAIATIDS
jgi:hydrogenase maturation factor